MLLVLLFLAQLASGEFERLYLDGLAAAREASAAGGSPDSLAPVRRAVAVLEQHRGPRAEIAVYVLRAAAAAAQSERDEMSLLIEHAVRLESVQLEAGEAGLPGVTAHEAAGDLWLRVHGYEQARQAYERAAARVGLTPRIRDSLATVCARVACYG